MINGTSTTCGCSACTSSCDTGACPVPNLCPASVRVHDCDDVHPLACTIVYFNDEYFLSKVADATGNPTLAANDAMWDGAYQDFDSALNAKITCLNLDTNTESRVSIEADGSGGWNVFNTPFDVLTNTAGTPVLVGNITAGTVSNADPVTGERTVTFPDGTSACIKDCTLLDCEKEIQFLEEVIPAVSDEFDVIADTPDWTEHATGNISLAALQAAGMTSCHNMVRLHVGTAAGLQETTNDPISPNSILTAGVTINGNLLRRFKAEAQISTEQTGSGEAKIVQDHPIDMVDGVNISFSHGATGIVGREIAKTQSSVRVIGFKTVNLV